MKPTLFETEGIKANRTGDEGARKLFGYARKIVTENTIPLS